MKLSLRPSAAASFAFLVVFNFAYAVLPPDAGNVVVDVNNNTILKLDATNGNVLWSVFVPNDGALAIDSADFSVYTAIGGHATGTDGATFKFAANGAPVWSGTISLNSFCDFEFVTSAAVDATSS